MCYYDSVFDKALDDVFEQREKERAMKLGLYVNLRFEEKIAVVNGVECSFKDFMTFSSKLFESYYASVSEDRDLTADFIVFTKKISEGREFSHILEFFAYRNKSIRLIGEYSNEIGDTIAFDRVYKSGELIIEEFLDKYKQILRKVLPNG